MIEKLIDYTTRMNGQRLPLKAFIRLSLQMLARSSKLHTANAVGAAA